MLIWDQYPTESQNSEFLSHSVGEKGGGMICYTAMDY